MEKINIKNYKKDYVSDWRIRCLTLKEKCKTSLYLY